MSQKINRVGETVLTSCGLNATIIEYRNANDLDIQFEDGSCRQNITYSVFKTGQIKHPDRTAEKRLNETMQMKNGQMATIINYRSATDIDIKFEDGVIVTNKTYGQFKRKEIRNPYYKPANNLEMKRVGETRLMTNGMQATIIAYRNSVDIDIQFEDGTIRKHARYGHFKSGKIHPIYLDDRTNNDRNNRIGEKRAMHCGLEATIIEYVNSHNITIQFEDGTIATKKYYRDFVNGVIQYSGNNPIMSPKAERLGQTKQMLCGQTATVIAYRSSQDIDVKFEDGQIRHNVEYRSFYNGRLKHPSELHDLLKQERIGETNIMNNGLKAEIIAYHSYYDVDVKFEDGVIVKGKRYEKFQNGEIPHPNIKYKISMSIQEFAIKYYLRQLGFKKIHQGEWANKGFGRLELDFYHPEKKIAIEYDGSIHNKPGNLERDVRKNQKCKDMGIKIYRLRDPYCKPLNDNNSIDYVLDRQKQLAAGFIDCKQELQKILNDNGFDIAANYIDFNRDKNNIMNEYNNTYINYYAKERLGQTLYNKSEKQNMTIIKYNSSTDVDVQFEDGTIRHGVTYADFQNNTLCHLYKTSDFLKQQRLGEQKVMNNGLRAMIIEYRKADDIDVKFEDNTIVKNKKYADFTIGNIGYPGRNSHLPDKDQRLGESKTMNNGQKATIVKYVSSNNVDVRFEDGSIRSGVSYSAFHCGSVAHPNDVVIAVKDPTLRLNESKVMNNGMRATIIEYRNAHDIDVQFDDGTVRKGLSYSQFKNKSVVPYYQTRAYIKQQRTGETKMMKCGLQCTIVRYKNSKDIDVEFEDGSVVRTDYQHFQHCSILPH